MEYENLRSKSIEQYLNEVLGVTTVGARDEIQAPLAVVGRCTLEVSHSLAQLSADIGKAQQVLGTRMSELTEKLDGTRETIDKGSQAASKQTSSLVLRTKALVFVTLVYASFTGRMLYLTAISLPREKPTPISVLEEPAGKEKRHVTSPASD